MTRVFLALGSNLGDRPGYLRGAVLGLREAADVTVVAVSPIYESEPVGGPQQPQYLNAVVELETDLSPRSLLGLAQRLERGARRVRNVRWGPRTLDVDVLLVGTQRVSEPDLVVPHPRMGERAFVLAPLGDLAPDLVETPPAGWRGVRRAAVPWEEPDSP